MIKEIIKENDLKNPAEIYAYLRDGFKDIIQEMLEPELDRRLSYTNQSELEISKGISFQDNHGII